MSHKEWPLDEKPLLIFWETTKACGLACKHCRAEAIHNPLPNELNNEEGKKLIDQISEFGKPSPILVFTGGDPLSRKDIWDLIDYANKKGVVAALSPSVTPLLNDDAIENIVNHKISSVSISLDSPYPEIHDKIRGINGTWNRSIEYIKKMVDKGIKVQINTTVMRSTVEGLPDMVSLLKKLNISVWEVFYLIPVGRAKFEEDLTKEEWEDVGAFLYEASKYGLTIRTTEGPMFRRIALLYRNLEIRNIDYNKEILHGELYYNLVRRLRENMGEPNKETKAETFRTRDGRGIVFVSYDGYIYPSGFLPYPAGNVRKQNIVDIYRNSELFKKLRSAQFKGKCGLCEFRNICGGSRARAFSYTGDPFADDPACSYNPGEYDKILGKYGLSYDDLR
ncbi:radical SAM protein, BA_1875 family [Caldisphaera lagunensis DSM 15908]|uniref:Radical SAM protein, BA_1875 family n=1 Tax=Caldisphaera lagunensis (strain DSM 15908 / JCM 11604 / ANMR 0165 / IC-154) TaxID=1056495 RepID=L0A9M7_CALLD|nr:TIGR04053 family radical SAM/SPASM domain-containing protein [Caldisphaera lagunensis]AFZ69847.1 radical SAM protein, BA_1875 family [Caldisphaera lagunensis DSM 15908]